jgi:SAM-dependent methyltransferase
MADETNMLRQLLDSYLRDVIPQVKGAYAVAHIEKAFFAGAGAAMIAITKAGGNTRPVVLELDAYHAKLGPEHYAAQCGDGPVTFVQTDLNMVDLEPESADGLMMSDFLQHLGNHEAQRAFLHKGFRALRHGGWFYLTFFNTNIKHRWRGDIVGAFAGGTMPYRRLTKSIVREMLPPEIHVRRAQPMNIANGLTADRLLCSLPFASTLSRMMLMTGYKR